MSISEIYKLFISSSGISIDSRIIVKNNLFLSLKGPSFNGNKFAIEALEKGAKYAIIDEHSKNTRNNDKIILVKDVLVCLQELAKFHRKKIKTKIIAITGSNGKTTTKELIKVVLEKKFKTIATKGNLNNHIGVPLTILNISKETEIGIIEMGANHKGEIKNLCEIAMPNIGYITNFGKAHLEGFKSLKGVIEGKSELYNYLIEKNGEILINSNDKTQLIQTHNYKKKKTFGNSKKSDFVFKFISSKNENLSIKNDEFIFSSSIYGNYNFNNICAAIVFGKIFNISNDSIQNGISSYKPKNNRSEIIKKKNTTIILDAYNANPSSMNEALEAFKENNITKKSCVILGDMLELGKHSIKEHAKIISKCLKIKVHNILLVGDFFLKSRLDDNYNILYFKSINELNDHLKKNKIKYDKVLIKGSRKIGLEKIIDFL
ncbi:MAG: UDP-N-acetylmuramoyl-tripeptide--D-alanyl-D-alanine ligase [Flavobacteriaceae bacterium]|nr:UDP-N-acetylmuramoyl-tripeptide--D-alanyl-D-alanine ligase [Flavobacteriaceae bacterium]|tara:strand:+ start:58690 stop:59988 length:1299 start_codon:yes stop_codon:yes gene_type:complete